MGTVRLVRKVRRLPSQDLRRDGVILGGTSERNVWTLDVNEAERKRVVEGHMQLFSAFRQVRQVR